MILCASVVILVAAGLLASTAVVAAHIKDETAASVAKVIKCWLSF